MIHGRRAELMVGLIISQRIRLSVSICISISSFTFSLQSILRAILTRIGSSQR